MERDEPEPGRTHDGPDAQSSRWVLAGIGLAQGLVYWGCYELWPDEGPGQAPWAALAGFVTVAGGVAQLVWDGRRRARTVATAGATGLLFALVTFWICRQLPPADAAFAGDGYRLTTWIPAAAAALFVLAPFLQIFVRSGSLRFPYPRLFFHSWTNLFIAQIGMLHGAVFWALILLWGALFDLIGIGFFEDLFEEAWFRFLTTPTVIAYGIASGRDNARVTDAGRGAALAVFRLLMPLLAAISLLFVGALPFTGLQPLWDTGHASALLLTLMGLAVLFLNAVFEDGERDPPYATWVRRAVEVAVLVLPVYAALTLYSLFLRVGQYGLSPGRVWALAIGGVTALYAASYAAAVLLRGEPWLRTLRPANVGLSVFVAALLLLLHSPVLDPLRWSARSQVARLASGSADASAFDYAFLRFQLGHAGHAALARLEALDAHPEVAAIRRGIERARGLEHYEPPDVQLAARRLSVDHLTLYGGVKSVPGELLGAFSTRLQERERAECVSEGRCGVFEVDLDGDGASEYCLMRPAYFMHVDCFARESTGGWVFLGRLAPRQGIAVSSAKLLELLAASQPEPVLPRYSDVRIGDVILETTR